MSRLARFDFEELDRKDPLASYREKFDIPMSHIYLDGNSLGVLPGATKTRMREVVEKEWGNDLIRSWVAHDWINIPGRVGDKIARIVGARSGEVVVCDSTSVNLFKLAGAALKMNAGRSKIISEAGNFPTDLYILQGLVEFLGGELTLQVIARDEIMAAIDEETALVVLTHVHYKTGEMFDMDAITALAHSKGALMLWDLSHSAGAVPVDLNAGEVDFAVGCGYKYLNGGPGAPAFLYVKEKLQNAVCQPLSGWFGHADPFQFSDNFEPAPGINRMLCGTTNVLAASALEEGVEIMASVDMQLLRQKSALLGDLFIELVETCCPDFEIASPHLADHRGSHVSICHSEGYAIMQALIARNIIGDFRAPDFLRFGFTPLYARYVDIWDTVAALVDIMKTKAWDCDRFKQTSVVT
jgi:kynureninase